MKIAFLCPSLSRTVGGIFEIERRLAQSLALIPGTQLEVFGPADEHTEADRPAWHPLKPMEFACTGSNSFRYSSTLRDSFRSATADVAHLHALWMYNSILIHHWSQKRKSPYVVTPNGMLEPWALRNSGWKKRIAGVLYERRMLSKAACIQANTEKEAADIRAFGLKNPICIIPNGIDLPEDGGPRMEDGCLTSDLSRLASGRKTLLYLGRIHPKKGLVNLLRAWSKVQKMEAGSPSSVIGRPSSEWRLAIAGWDQGGHEDELKRLCTELQIPFADIREHSTFNIDRPTSNAAAAGGGFSSSIVRPQTSSFSVSDFQRFSVLFLGPQFNDAKAACYASCDAFILPSFSEGVPMVVLEAWAHGKPVLMTPECNLPAGFAANAAIRIETSTESIAQGLQDLFRLPDSDRRLLGANGRQLVAQKFTWPKIAAEMKSVYEWVLGGGQKPECVQTKR